MDDLIASYMDHTKSELHSNVVSLVKNINSVKADIKAYSSAGRATIKELEERIEAILAVLRKKEAEALEPSAPAAGTTEEVVGG